MIPKQPSLVVIAANQDEYIPLPAAAYDNGAMMTEWALTAEELMALVDGGHIRLWTWTFGMPLQPLMFQVVRPDGHPVVEAYAGTERRVQAERRRIRLGNDQERRWAQRRRS